MIEGLSHMTFIAEDLNRMEDVLVGVLDARKIYDSGADTHSIAPERFYELAGLWIAVMQGMPLSERTYNHVAFKISADDYDSYLQRIRDAGLDLREGRSRISGEGQSLYFYDHDNHLFELHTGTLSNRLDTYQAAAKAQ